MTGLSKFNIPIRQFGRKKKRKRPKKTKRKKIKDKSNAPIVNRFVYDPLSAFKMLKVHSYVSFDENMHLYIRLGTDPKRSEFNVRGSCYLPYGNGKSVKVGFVPGNDEEKNKATEAKVDIIVEQKELDNIQKGVFNFDKLYATNEGIKLLKPLARILGPKGLFPNKKVFWCFAFYNFDIIYCVAYNDCFNRGVCKIYKPNSEIMLFLSDKTLQKIRSPKYDTLPIFRFVIISFKNLKI